MIDQIQFSTSLRSDFEAEEWSRTHWPFPILVDRGEFATFYSDNLPNKVKITTQSTGPRRGDSAPIIERAFQRFKDRLVVDLPGAQSDHRAKKSRRHV
jgi:hypothetical protein